VPVLMFAEIAGESSQPVGRPYRFSFQAYFAGQLLLALSR